MRKCHGLEPGSNRGDDRNIYNRISVGVVVVVVAISPIDTEVLASGELWDPPVVYVSKKRIQLMTLQLLRGYGLGKEK